MDRPLHPAARHSANISEYSALDRLISLKSGKQTLELLSLPSLQDFQIGELLGKGAMGNVYMCRQKVTGYFFALKKIKKSSVKDIEQFIISIKIHISLRQPNIVQLYSLFDDKEHIYLLLEACLDGNLKGVQNELRRSPKQIKKVTLEIAYGLRHLHKKGIRHGDIKLQNIVYSYGMPKIGDFDTICSTKNSVVLSKNYKQGKFCGSPLYFSPQMIKLSIFSINDDVWSLGILLYQLVCGYHPFDIKSNNDLSKIVNQDIKPFPPEIGDQSLKDLIRSMLSKRLYQRPRLSTIIKQLQTR